MARHGVPITILRRLRAVIRAAGGLRAELGIDGFGFREHRTADAVVAEMGTELYDALVADSTNHGAVDLAALLAGDPQDLVRNPAGSFRLFRIGDAVSSRNVHTAILDGARVCRAV